MFGTEPTCVAVCPRPPGDGVPVLRHHTGHHTVLQLLPAEFLDALHPGHGHGRRPAAAPAQVQVSARRRTLHKSKHRHLIEHRRIRRLWFADVVVIGSRM